MSTHRFRDIPCGGTNGRYMPIDPDMTECRCIGQAGKVGRREVRTGMPEKQDKEFKLLIVNA